MSKFFLIFVAVLTLSVQVCCVSKQLTPELYKRVAYNSVAMVEVEFEIHDLKSKTISKPSISATAFAIDKKYLATAGHFCMGVFEYALKSRTLKSKITYVDKDEELSESMNFKIITIDVKNDLCIIEKPNHRLIPVKLVTDYKPKIRDKVFTVGAPHGIFPIETEGFVSVPSIRSSDKELNGKIMCSLPIYRGNSGSPVYDDNRRCYWSYCDGK